MAPERRLAAIMFTDIVGYTALMADSEERGLAARRRHRELVRPLVEQFTGEAIEARGDESLSIFPSALNAVMCALAVQEALEDEEMRLHIGIHLGDIVLEDSEVSGDGVNIASRLCSLSDGNSVLVSGELYSSVRNQPGIKAKAIGERELHNVGRPVQVYRVSGQGSEPRAPAADSQDILGRPAVAVLPFDNLSGDPDQDYFADGIAEDLITRLSIFRAFPVIARNSSFVYKGQSVPVQQVARDLSVRYVVEGSVRKAGQRVRVSVQLIDATTEQHVWARVRPRVVRPGSRPGVSHQPRPRRAGEVRCYGRAMEGQANRAGDYSAERSVVIHLVERATAKLGEVLFGD